VFNLLIRRGISLIKKVCCLIGSHFHRFFIIYGNSNITINNSCQIESNVKISCTDNGSMSIGGGVYLSSGAEIICRGGKLYIGNNVHIGKGVIIVCVDKIEIDDDTLIAEYVVIRDQDHASNTRPIRNSGFISTPIIIGKDCWLGAKSTVLRGSIINVGSIIGAHSLVRGEIPPYSIAVGCPAKVIKQLPLLKK